MVPPPPRLRVDIDMAEHTPPEELGTKPMKWDQQIELYDTDAATAWDNVRMCPRGVPDVDRNLAKEARRLKAMADTPLKWKLNAREEERQPPLSRLRRLAPRKWCGGREQVVDATLHVESEEAHRPCVDFVGRSECVEQLFVPFRSHLPPSQVRTGSRTLYGSCSADNEEGLNDEFRSALLRDVGPFHPGNAHNVYAAFAEATHEVGAQAGETPVDTRTGHWRRDHVSSEQVSIIQHDLLEQGSDVTLHVYDLADWTRVSNLPIFHLGVQVYRLEYFFSSRGIQTCVPRQNKGHVFKQSLHLGRTNLNLRECRAELHHLRQDWPKESYRLLGRNCQSFAITLCDALGLPGCVPTEFSHFSELEDIRTQVAGVFDGAAAVFDGAAALLPRAPDASFLLGCSMPSTLSDVNMCGHARDCEGSLAHARAQRPAHWQLQELNTPSSQSPVTPESPDAPVGSCFLPARTPESCCEEDFLPAAAAVAMMSAQVLARRARPETCGGG